MISKYYFIVGRQSKDLGYKKRNKYNLFIE